MYTYTLLDRSAELWLTIIRFVHIYMYSRLSPHSYVLSFGIYSTLPPNCKYPYTHSAHIPPPFSTRGLRMAGKYREKKKRRRGRRKRKEKNIFIYRSLHPSGFTNPNQTPPTHSEFPSPSSLFPSSPLSAPSHTPPPSPTHLFSSADHPPQRCPHTQPSTQ